MSGADREAPAPGSEPGPTGAAWFSGWRARRPVRYADLRKEPAALAEGGWWGVVAEFEGAVHAWRFSDVQ